MSDAESGSEPAPPSSYSRSPPVVPDRLVERGKASGRLGFLLAWAVVYADIGTSI